MSLQQFSVFHETSAEGLREWHRPYAKLLRNCKRVLDVGCGPGYFADELKALDVETLGIDLDPAMVSLSIERGHLAELGDQDWLRNHTNEFDAVHVSHVVEHLWGDELVKLLTLAYHSLRPEGIIVIRTPNWENRYVRERLFWMDHTHTRPYPRELLLRMLKDIGMESGSGGAEPDGMNDTYVLAIKASTECPAVEFPLRQDPPRHNLLRTLKSRLKSRLQSFLEIA